MAVGRFGFLSSRVGERIRTGAVVGILALIAACCAAGYFYVQIMGVVNERATSLRAQPRTAGADIEKEIKELDDVSVEFTRMTNTSTESMQTALLAEVSSRYPVADVKNIIPSGSVAVDLFGDGIPTTGQEVELDPPQVTVLAIMISGKDKIAMINVLGEDTGLVVRQGTPFSAGTAKVTNIDEKGVTFKWMEKSYTVVM